MSPRRLRKKFTLQIHNKVPFCKSERTFLAFLGNATTYILPNVHSRPQNGARLKLKMYIAELSGEMPPRRFCVTFTPAPQKSASL